MTVTKLIYFLDNLTDYQINNG